MREIKFRVWNGERYITKSSLHEENNDKCLILELDGSLIDIAYDRFDDCTNEYVIEQFTGLYDKNGKEIYEGDNIILHQFLFDGDEYENQLIGQVIYDDNQACYCLTNIKNEQVQEYMGYKDNYTNFQKETVPINLFYGMHEESFEVIGNIHDKEEAEVEEDVE